MIASFVEIGSVRGWTLETEDLEHQGVSHVVGHGPSDEVGKL
jgi:hypothetical protein